jgi:mediator of RNA polymerase II transcription subunit 21
MDIISQLQEQVNTIAALAFNTFGTLQRDAPPVRLSPNYPEPPPNNAEDTPVNISEQPKPLSAALVKAAKQVCHLPGQECCRISRYSISTTWISSNFKVMPKLLLQFDALVTALPLSEGGEEAQLKRIRELQVWSRLTD